MERSATKIAEMMPVTTVIPLALNSKSTAPTPASIHAIRLTKFNIKLKPNVLYRWSVAVVVDPENRSQDIIANGVIKRIDPSSALATQLGC